MTVDEILLAFLKSNLLIREARFKVLQKQFPKIGVGFWVLEDEEAVIEEMKRQIDELELGDML